MALAIASIPVLTGEVAENFELQAQKAYDSYTHRSEDEQEKARVKYEQGVKMVHKILAKSKLRAK